MSLVDLLADAGLAGLGGAGFPTATKLAAASANRARLIVNACDGEVGAAKDGYLVATALPHLLEGAELLTAELGHRGRRRVRYACHRGSRTAGLLTAAGVDVLEVPARYVSSEASALVSYANGGDARPFTKHARLAGPEGVDSRGRRVTPTLVLNAETVVRVAQIARNGVGWFRSFGTPAEPGPRLVSIGGAVARPGVHETEAGVPIEDLLAAAGGLTDDVAGLNLGGIGGSWIGAGDARGTRWSRADLAPLGADLSSGVLHVLGTASCPIAYVSALAEYAARSSAGQCGPCMFGVPSVAQDLRALATGSADPHLLVRLHGRLGLLPGRGACHFPDGVARFAASAMAVFAGHAVEHASGWCSTRTAPRHLQVQIGGSRHAV
jgi:NADH:ubiquinone oxidoreductase subunit F (NADH-binding)